jgi:hypothetical protein
LAGLVFAVFWSIFGVRKEITMTSNAENTAEVVQLRPKASIATRASERKWGKSVMDLGFCIVPSLLLRAQARMGLNPTQLALLMHLADYWWDADRKPYPMVKTLGERLKLGPRQVRRYLAELETAGLIKRVERRAAHRGKMSNVYDLSGLVNRLKELEPEFRQVEAEVKKKRRAVTRPGARLKSA